jgi:HSP20 family molecular chaperone IbpA
MFARFDDLNRAFSEFDEMLDRFAYDHAQNETADPATQPWRDARDVSVHENESSLCVSFDVQGLNQTEVAVTIENGVLTITLAKSGASSGKPTSEAPAIGQ